MRKRPFRHALTLRRSHWRCTLHNLSCICQRIRKTFVHGLGTVSTTKVVAPHVRIVPLLADDREAKLFEIPIKAEADHVIEEHGDHDKRDGITP